MQGRNHPLRTCKRSLVYNRLKIRRYVTDISIRFVWISRGHRKSVLLFRPDLFWLLLWEIRVRFLWVGPFTDIYFHCRAWCASFCVLCACAAFKSTEYLCFEIGRLLFLSGIILSMRYHLKRKQIPKCDRTMKKHLYSVLLLEKENKHRQLSIKLVCAYLILL